MLYYRDINLNVPRGLTLLTFQRWSQLVKNYSNFMECMLTYLLIFRYHINLRPPKIGLKIFLILLVDSMFTITDLLHFLNS